MAKRDLVWCEPPPGAGHPNPATEELLADLGAVKERPGEWCRVRVFDSVNGASRARNTLAKRNGQVAGFQFTTRRVDTDKSGLWVRFQEEDQA